MKALAKSEESCYEKFAKIQMRAPVLEPLY